MSLRGAKRRGNLYPYVRLFRHSIPRKNNVGLMNRAPTHSLLVGLMNQAPTNLHGGFDESSPYKSP